MVSFYIEIEQVSGIVLAFFLLTELTSMKLLIHCFSSADINGFVFARPELKQFQYAFVVENPVEIGKKNRSLDLLSIQQSLLHLERPTAEPKLVISKLNKRPTLCFNCYVSYTLNLSCYLSLCFNLTSFIIYC